MYILAGASISQSYQRYKYLKYISEYRVQKASEIETIVEELDQRGEELNGLKNEKLSLLEEKETELFKDAYNRSRYPKSIVI